MQYAILGLWSAMNSGVVAHAESVERALTLLAGCQDPRGGWGYQVSRNRGDGDVTFCRTAAALGSMYVCADYLGLSKTPDSHQDEREINRYVQQGSQ